MDVETKYNLIAAAPTEEIITSEELRTLLETKDHPVAYDGFEPSGMAHLGSGLMRAIKLEHMLKAGVKFKILIADWHAWINNKMGGDLDMIKQVGKYLIEVWTSLGVDTKKIEYVWASELVDSANYWSKVIRIAKGITAQRLLRCLTIMGRQEGELQACAQYFYPPMQVADIFELGADICQLGMDQRKANVLAREVGPKLGWWAPVCVHHHMLAGLLGPTKMGIEFSGKMSKSQPKSAIFVHDSPQDIRDKIKGGFCPEKQVEENPLLEYCKYLIFPKTGKLEVTRPAKFGGDLTFASSEELETVYREGKLHPLDLKNAVAESLIKILEPSRNYFEKHPESLEVFKGPTITR